MSRGDRGAIGEICIAEPLIVLFLLDRFKRQGDFDALRRQLLSTFTSSTTTKEELLSDISNMLLSYFEAAPAEANKIAKMGDVRLQQSECLRLLDVEDLPRQQDENELNQNDSSKDIAEGSSPAEVRSGPAIFRRLVEQIRNDPTSVKAEVNETEPDHAASVSLASILSPKGSVGKVVKDKVDLLLKEEVKDGEKVLAPPTPAASTPVQQSKIEDDKEADQKGAEPVKQEEVPQEESMAEPVQSSAGSPSHVESPPQDQPMDLD